MVEIDECVGGPQRLAQLLASDEIALVLEEQEQQLKRLFLQRDLGAVFTHFSRARIRLVRAETHDPCAGERHARTLVRDLATRQASRA